MWQTDLSLFTVSDGASEKEVLTRSETLRPHGMCIDVRKINPKLYLLIIQFDDEIIERFAV